MHRCLSVSHLSCFISIFLFSPSFNLEDLLIAFCLLSSFTIFFHTNPTCPTPTWTLLAISSCFSIKGKASRKAANVSTSACWFWFNKYFHMFPFSPVRYKTDHNSWLVFLLKLPSAVTYWISTFNILDIQYMDNANSWAKHAVKMRSHMIRQLKFISTGDVCGFMVVFVS